MQPATSTSHAAPTMPLQSQAIIPDNKTRATSRFVFFAGDVITSTEKYAVPERNLGGVELEMFHTLKESGKEIYARPELTDIGGLLYRCAITELRAFYLPINRNMVDPKALEAGGRYVTGYVKPNGRYNASTGKYEDIYIGGPDSSCVYAEIYPGDEVFRIVQATNDLKPGGIVEIAALAGKTQEEKHAVQLHFFPNWNDIQLGNDEFPARLKALRSQLVTKLGEAGVGNILRPSGAQMIRSCDEFRLWGLRYLKAWRKIVAAADKELDSPINGYNDLAEMLFEMLEVKREDQLSQADAANESIDRLADVLINRLTAGQPATATKADIPAFDPTDPRIQALIQEQVKLALAGVQGAPVETVPPLVDVTAGAPNAEVDPENLRTIVLENDNKLQDETNAAANTFTLGQKAQLVEDGREGEVVWKGPGKVKLKFEDGTTKVVATTEAIPAAPPEE